MISEFSKCSFIFFSTLLSDQYPQLSLNTNHKLSSRSFCSCQQGSVGQSGAPGDNGSPGVDGMPGTDGNNGRDAKILVVLEKVE